MAAAEGAAEKFSWRQWRVLVLLLFLRLLATAATALHPTLYPLQAATMGISASGSGLVFGGYQLATLLISPFILKIVEQTGAAVSIHLGMLLTGTCCISIGLLELSTSQNAFLWMSLAARIVEAAGAAIVHMGIFSLVLVTFPNSVASIHILLSLCSGIGAVISPVIGALLYEVAGFMLPFVGIGFLLLSLGYVAPCVCPPDPHPVQNTEKMNLSSVRGALRITAVQVDVVCIASASFALGFFSPVLQPHLQRLGFGPIEASFGLVLLQGTAAIAAPVISLLCDAGLSGLGVASAGLMATFLGAGLLGPAPFLDPYAVWPACSVGLIVTGLGVAFTLGSAFVDGINALVQHGYGDDMETFGLMAAVFTGGSSLGGFVGPLVSGVLSDTLGFRTATLFILGVTLAALIVVAAYAAVGALGRSTTPIEDAREVDSNGCSRQSSTLSSKPPVSDATYGSVEVFY